MTAELTDETIMTNRAKWTAALRSDEYQQGKDMLATPGYETFCCLGVACEVLGEEYGVRRELDPNDPEGGMYAYEIENWYGGVGEPETVHEAGELPSPLYGPLGLSYSNQCRLAAMNDNDRKTFAEIADYVDSLPISREVYADGALV